MANMTNGHPGPSAHDDRDDPRGEYAFLDKIIRHLDRHLIFPLLEHMTDREDISPARFNDLTKAKYALLKDTNMHDYVANLWKLINDSDQAPDEFTKKRGEVLHQLEVYQEESDKITSLLGDDAVVSQLRSDKVANLKFLEEQHGVTAQMVDVLYDYGRYQYQCGNYGDAAELLYQFRVLSTDNDKVSKATWGKLVCEILVTNWEGAMEEINKLKENIETRLFNNPRAQLVAREQLVHWALFPFFNYEPARETLTELYFSPPYISSIQTACPWILRYLAAAVITNRTRGKNAMPISHNYQKQLKDLVRVVKQEVYEYEDAVTELVKALYVDFDFEEAQRKLGEAEEILRDDFFLGSSTDNFVEASRHLISESYCKIHQRIDIK
jgi:translation initiation factor 3 subunit E